MNRNYPEIMEWLEVYEGGLVNHPKDPGGKTNRGITQRVYNAFRKRAGKKVRDVALLTDEEHDLIYREQYWNPVKGAELPDGVDASVFDFAVNSGPSRAVKELQKVLGVTADGFMGAITLQAVNDFPNKRKLIADHCHARMRFLKKLKHYRTFGEGWKRRVMGDVYGYQDGDIGVIDRAIGLHKRIKVPPPKTSVPGKSSDSDWSVWTKIGRALCSLVGR